MSHYNHTKPLNEYGQSLGHYLGSREKSLLPLSLPLIGTHSMLEPLDIAKHSEALYDALCRNNHMSSWTYLPYGPFLSLADFKTWLHSTALEKDPFLYSVISKEKMLPLGLIALTRMRLDDAAVEIGHVNFGDQLKRNTCSTEALYLLLKEVFDKLGYRRCEWKCNSLNEASKRAALRFGFRYEGCFRQDRIVKGHSRDTSWYSLIDSEWPALRSRMERWLHSSNFHTCGMQRLRLEHI